VQWLGIALQLRQEYLVTQVHLMKQEKVACLIDNDATLALDPSDTYAVQVRKCSVQPLPTTHRADSLRQKDSPPAQSHPYSCVLRAE
jgi:hypothetical protein